MQLTGKEWRQILEVGLILLSLVTILYNSAIFLCLIKHDNLRVICNFSYEFGANIAMN